MAIRGTAPALRGGTSMNTRTLGRALLLLLMLAAGACGKQEPEPEPQAPEDEEAARATIVPHAQPAAPATAPRAAPEPAPSPAPAAPNAATPHKTAHAERAPGARAPAPIAHAAPGAAAGTSAATPATAAPTAAVPGATPSAPAPVAAPCGEQGQPACPLQGFMQHNLQAPLDAGNLALVAQNLARVRAFVPDSGWNGRADAWNNLVDAAIGAANSGGADTTRAACKSCHRAWRAKYKASFRTRPLQ